MDIIMKANTATNRILLFDNRVEIALQLPFLCICESFHNKSLTLYYAS